MQEVIGSNPIFSTKAAVLLSTAAFCIVASTTAIFSLMRSTKQNQYVSPKLYNRKGDLSKRWYIEFQAWNEETGQLEKKQVFCPAKFKSAREREIWGKDTCKEINSLLEKGYCFKSGGGSQGGSTEAPPVSITINEVFDLAIRKTASLRKKSASTYTGILEKFRTFLGSAAAGPIEGITKTLVSEYQDFLLSQDLTAVTINNQCNITRIMIGKAVKAEYIAKNPFIYTKLNETDSNSNTAFTPRDKETLEIYMQERAPGLYLFTRIMYYNFIRPKELRLLRVRDFDFDSQTITVPGPVAKNRKTNTVPIHPILFDLVKDQRSYPGNFYLIGKNFKPGQFQLAENYAYEAHKKVLQDCSLYEGYDYTLYSWRHTGAVNAYRAGTDIKTLQFLFRHASVIYTEIYLKSLKLQLRDIKFKNW